MLKLPLLGTTCAIFSIFSLTMIHADSFSEVDKIFVAKVSQGGMFEVKLGILAETHGATQDIRDSGNTEAHDHTLVGNRLKSITEANGIAFLKKLNVEFQGRLDKMTDLSKEEFDSAYLSEMKKVHDADGAAFAKEAKEGTNPELKAFAAETHRIVDRHLGELNADVK